MRATLISIGIAAALFLIYLFIFPSVALWSVTGILSIVVFVAVVVGIYLTRHWRLREWARTSGRIEYCCKLGEPAEGAQQYSCAYMYSVDGVRQGGELRFSNKANQLEQIKSALVGTQITVRYNPRDCAHSIVEETSIHGWKLR